MNEPSRDERIQFITNAFQFIDADVALHLWKRGWALADPHAERLEWFWPPTSPPGASEMHQPEIDGANVVRVSPPSDTSPWTTPTRIRQTDNGWRVEFGAAIAQDPDPAVDYTEGEPLLKDLERIECWPMSVEETMRIRNERIVEVTYAAAHDQFCLAIGITEPYATRLAEIRAWKRYEGHVARLFGLPHSTEPTAVERPTSHRDKGDLDAQAQIVEAAAWASAARSARAGGRGFTGR